MTDAESETPHFDLQHQYAGVPMDEGKARPCADASADVHTGPGNLHLDYCSHTTSSPSRALGTIAWGNPFPSPLLPWTPLLSGSGGLVAGPVHGGILHVPGVGPKPIPRWDVQFGGLEDHRKDSTSLHITHRS